jgi:hypothetical protein
VEIAVVVALVAQPTLAAEEDAQRGRRLVDGVPLALLASVYQHVSDSDGALARAQTVLIFDRRGVAFLGEDILYADGHRARAGRYSYRDGSLSIRVAGPNLARDAVVALTPGAQELTLPFKPRSTERGTSLWRRPPHWDVDSTVCAILNSVRLAEGADLKVAIERAAKWAKAFIVPLRREQARPDADRPPAIPRLSDVASSEGSLSLTDEYGFEIGILFGP